MKNIKKGSLIFKFAVVICIVLCMTIQIMAAGSNSTPETKPTVGSDGSPTEIFSQGGSGAEGMVSSWNKNYKAVVIPTNLTRPIESNNSSSFTQGGDWKQGDYHISVYDHDKEGKRVKIQTINYHNEYNHCIDLGNAKFGEPKITYKGCYVINEDMSKTPINIEVKFVKWDTKTAKIGKVTTADPGNQRYNTPNPTVMITKALKGGLPSIKMINIADLNIRTSFYNADTGKPIKIKSNVTYFDVDSTQAQSIKADKINGMFVTHDSLLNYVYDEKDGYHIFQDSSNEEKSDEKNPENAFAIAYEGDSISQIFTSDQCVYNPKNGKWEPHLESPSGFNSYFGPSSYTLFKIKPNNPHKSVSQVVGEGEINSSDEALKVKTQ